MKIALVYATDFDRISPGGIQNYLRRLITSGKDLFDLTVYGVGSPPEDLGVKFVSVISNPTSVGKLNLHFSLAMRLQNLSQYDVVIFQRAENVVFTRKRRDQRFILFLHGGTLNAWRFRKDYFSALYPFFEFLASAKSSRIFPVSISDTLSAKFFPSKAKSAPRVFDSDVFRRITSSANRNSFAVIGRLSPEKQFHLAIESLSTASKTLNTVSTLYVIGSGPEEKNLRKYIGLEHVRLVFLGQLDPKSISKLLNDEISALIITSKFEGYPLAAIEAAACQVFVLGLEAPGVTGCLQELGMEVCQSKLELVKSLQRIIQSGPPPVLNTIKFVDESRKFWNDL